MSFNDAELKILESLLSLLTVAVGTAIIKYAPVAKKWLDKHLTKQESETANHIIDCLSKIAEATVQDFNQRVVTDAKRNGVFTPQLAQSVKDDSVKAVKDQGASLAKLGNETVGDIEQLIGSLVEKYVQKFHISTTDLLKTTQSQGQTQNQRQA